jgi:hypothetical protein
MHLLVRLACRDLQRGAARSIKLRRSHDSVTSVHPKRELVKRVVNPMANESAWWMTCVPSSIFILRHELSLRRISLFSQSLGLPSLSQTSRLIQTFPWVISSDSINRSKCLPAGARSSGHGGGGDKHYQVQSRLDDSSKASSRSNDSHQVYRVSAFPQFPFSGYDTPI